MNLQTFLNILFANWQNVLNFVQNFILSAISLIGNFWNIIQQKKQETLQDAAISALGFVTNGVNFVTTAYKAADSFLSGRIDQSVNYFLLSIQFAKESLGNLIEVAKIEGKELIVSSLSVIYGAVDTVESRLMGVINQLGLNIHQRIDGLILEFNKIVDMSGLSLAEKRALLKLFLDDPLGFIASVFFEIAIPLFLYELTRGLSNPDDDIGDPPIVSSQASDGFSTKTIKELGFME